MSSQTSKVLGIALALSVGLAAGAAFAAPAETPSPPVDNTKAAAPPDAKAAKDATKPSAIDPNAPATITDPAKPAQKKSSVDSPEFLNGYRAAYATIYERNDYTGAIVQLKALGQDDRADVANLIGYSYRKLGNFDLAQVWYERALKADPNHIKTWQYYGLWQVEKGNRARAMEHLNKIGSLCGYTCPEYQSLGEALATTSANY